MCIFARNQPYLETQEGPSTPEAAGARRGDFVGGVFGLVRAAGEGGRLDTGGVQRKAGHEFEGVSIGDPGAHVYTATFRSIVK